MAGGAGGRARATFKDAGLLLLGAGLWGGRGGLRWLPFVFVPPVAAIAYGVTLARRDRPDPGSPAGRRSVPS